MPRPCGPCGDKRRNELDRSLLEMEITGETFRGLSREFGYSEDALSRHKSNHLVIDLSEAKQAVEKAKEEAKQREAEVAKAATLADLKEKAVNSMSARLENAANFLDQLREIRDKAADLLDQAESAQDMKASGVFLRELREQIRLMAELEGRLPQAQVTIVNNPEWIELRTVIVQALDDYPQAKDAVVNAIRGR